MRVLLVSHPTLTSELGAAQLVLSLAAALRERGHDAVAWSPAPLPPGTGWWNAWRRQARAIERFARESGPFDVIDTPAITASRRLASAGALLARSVQPEFRYLWLDTWHGLRRHLSPSAVGQALTVPWRVAATRGGWRRARRILCMGSLERDWMARRYPAWRGKLGVYVCAPPAAERAAFAEVRRQRGEDQQGGSTRFLWLGRWAAHKGTRQLVKLLESRMQGGRSESFTIAGCGRAPERELPAAWIESGRVRIVPSYSRAELPALLAEHDAGLFTSDVEGWGLSLNEMLESGLIVFATEAGGVPDLRPYFPHRLRPFPPPERVEVEGYPMEDLEANGYYERFRWGAIAEGYEWELLVMAGKKDKA